MISLISMISPPYLFGENIDIVPKWQEITLVVSDWHEDISEGLISNLSMAIHPFAEVIVMTTPVDNRAKKRRTSWRGSSIHPQLWPLPPWLLLTTRLQISWIYVIPMWRHGGTWWPMLTTMSHLMFPFCLLTMTRPCWKSSQTQWSSTKFKSER